MSLDNKWGDFIKSHVSIKAYIERYDPLTDRNKSGEFIGGHHTHTSKNGRCLTVNDSKGVFHCYHCHAKGTVVNYEMDRNSVDFHVACETIANKMGLTLPTNDWTPEQQRSYEVRRKQDANILPLIQIAAEYYHRQLTPESRNYFLNRGFRNSTIDSELLGYAPKDERPLKTFLYNNVKKANPKLSDKEIGQRLIDTGLYTLNDDGKLNAVFRDRYIFTYYCRKDQVGYMIGRNASKSDTYTRRDGETGYIAKYKKLNTKTSDGKGKLPIARYHTLWGAHLLRTNGKPIVVPEGIVDAMLLRQEFGHRYQVISPVTTRINSADIDRIIEKLWSWGKGNITLIFCNDTEDTGVGAGGALETAEKLKAKWKSRVSAEQKLYEDKPEEQAPARPTLNLKIANLPCPPELEKIDVADYVQMRHTKELEYWLDSAQELWYHQAKDRNDPSRFFYKKSFKPKLVADEIRQQGRYFLNTSGCLYEYQDGVYRENENGLKTDIQGLLWEQSTNTHIQNTIKHISTDAYVGENEMMASDKINCLNGILDTETLELIPHSPYEKTLIQINAAWDEKAECPVIEKFLGQVLPADCQDLIREVIGYTIMQSNAYEKAILMVGNGSNGKSTFLNLIRAFLGKESYVAKSLHSLEDNRFASASLFGKLANICGDISSERLEGTSILKQITSSDAIDGERKFKGSFTFENLATNYFSCNELPPTRDRSYGFYRRWIILPFTYHIPKGEIDPDLRSKLTTPSELSGLLRLAIEGQKRLRVQRGFIIPESVKNTLSEYQLDNDSVMRFITDEVDISNPDVETARSKIYEAYKTYCEAQNVKPVSMIAFNKSIEKNKVATRLDNIRPKKWKGIAINTKSEFYQRR